jgi:translation initiation factor IF-2
MVVPKRMTDANEQDVTEQEQKRPLTLRSGGTLGLKRPAETGQVRQSFSHGRSKQVTVEVRKKRVFTPGAAPEPSRPEPPAPTVARAQPTAPAAPAASEPVRRSVGTPRTLTAEEHATRVRVLQDARKADEDQRRRAAIAEADRRRQEEQRAVEEARLQAEEAVRRRSEEEETKKRAEEEAKKRAEDEEVRRKEEESRREVAERAGKAAAAKVAALAAAGKMAVPAEEEEEASVHARRPGRHGRRRPSGATSTAGVPAN